MEAPRRLLEIGATRFRSLVDVDVPLGPLNVLVGPNNSGKSDLLDVIRFLSDSVHTDLRPALDQRGGFERVRFRDGDGKGAVSIRVKAVVTRHSSPNAPDEYALTFDQRQQRGDVRVLTREESFRFKRYRGPGRRITVEGQRVEFADDAAGGARARGGFRLRSDSLGLSTLPRLDEEQGGAEVRRMAELFSSFRVFDVDVAEARRPGPVSDDRLHEDAANLATFLHRLSRETDAFGDLVDDLRQVVPGIEDVQFEPVGGATRAVTVVVHERGLRTPTPLADASYGVVRLLALLALLYDPDPPELTCVEEIDHGLHPYALDLLVQRLREASARTQFLIATHSPSLVNRLTPNELIVCERRPDGSSAIPAIDPDLVRAKEEATGGELGLGELWFSGSLGGVP